MLAKGIHKAYIEAVEFQKFPRKVSLLLNFPDLNFDIQYSFSLGEESGWRHQKEWKRFNELLTAVSLRFEADMEWQQLLLEMEGRRVWVRVDSKGREQFIKMLSNTVDRIKKLEHTYRQQKCILDGPYKQ